MNNNWQLLEWSYVCDQAGEIEVEFRRANERPEYGVNFDEFINDSSRIDTLHPMAQRWWDSLTPERQTVLLKERRTEILGEVLRISSALKIAPSDRLKEVFRAPFTYDGHGTCIWDAETNKVLDIRGWGYLTGKGAAALGLSDVEASRLQDEIGNTVARLLNENWQ